MLKQLPIARAYLVPPVGVALLLAALFLLPETLKMSLVYDRSAILSGELWRLLSGQFMHLEVGHLALNMSGLLLFWLLFAEHAPGFRYLAVVVIIALGANMGMLVTDPNVVYYVGFSGTLYGMFAWGALSNVLQQVKLGWILLLGITGKAVYDYWLAPAAIEQGIVVVPTESDLAVSAHFYGVVTGIVLAFVQRALSARKRERDSSAKHNR